MAKYPTTYPTRAAADKQAARLRVRYTSVLVYWTGSAWGISYARKERKNAPPRKTRAKANKETA